MTFMSANRGSTTVSPIPASQDRSARRSIRCGFVADPSRRAIQHGHALRRTAALSNILRNAGYYFFRPDYIDYQADTTQRPERVQLRMQVKPTVPEVALRPYTTGSLTVQLQNIRPGIQDTLRLQDYRADLPEKTENPPESTLQSHHARQRKLFTVADQNKTLTNLNKLGVFRS